MMNFFYFLAFFSFILQTPFLATGDIQLIENTCKNTPSYELCRSILLANPKSKNADIYGLAIIMVGGVKDKANQGIQQIQSLIRSRPDLRVALSDCARVYNTVVIGDVNPAIDALNGGQPKYAEDGMADAAVEAQVCERSFGGHGLQSPLTQMNQAMQDVANIARAIIRNLE